MNPAGLAILEKARAEGRANLVEDEALELCRLYGIRGPRYTVARSEEEAVETVKQTGYPVVAKILSPDILHKSDVGGVRINLEDESALRSAYREILDSVSLRVPSARIWGIILEEMLPKGIESIVGMKRDPQFGPAVMFGLGGILVEFLEDVTFRIAPISVPEAEEMIREIKGYALLEGYRGMPVADKESIARCLSSVSAMVSELPLLEQIDLNPLIVYESGARVADARVIIGT